MRIFKRIATVTLLLAAILFCQTKTPYEPLAVLSQYPSYATCAELEHATAQTCPTWNPARQPKSWFDAAAKPMFTGPGGVQYTMYERIFLGKFGADGKGVIEQLILPVTEARTVNIAPKGPGMTNVPGADQPEVPTPLKVLGPNQAIMQYGPVAVAMVRNLDVPVVEPDAQQGEILKLLKAIALKLGVSP